MAAADYHTVVQQLYIAYFGRAADPEGMANYADDLARLNAPANIVDLSIAYNANSDIRDLVDRFGVSEESEVLYPLGNNSIFVDAIYQYLLNRAPDKAGKAYWKGEIDSGRLSKGNAALAIAAGAMVNGSLDGMLITKKTSIAIEFTNSLDTDAEKAAYAGEDAAEIARDMLAQVESDTTLAELRNLVESAVETLVENAEIPDPEEEEEGEEEEEEGEEGEEEEEEEEVEEGVLTSGKNTLTGTAGDDTFNGTIDSNVAKGTTFNAFDTLKGGSGTDTLQIAVSGGTSTAAVTVSSTKLESIESVLIANSGAANGYVFNAASWKDVKTLGLSSSSETGDTKFTSVVGIVEAQMKNGSADLEIDYQSSAVKGTTDNQKLILDKVMAGTFTADSGIETVTIVSTSANASTLTGLTAIGASTLVIQSAAGLTIQNPLSTKIKTVDASLSTGAVTLDFSKAAGNLTITGGKSSKITGGEKDDTFIFNATTISQAELYGLGGNDTFVVDGNLSKPITMNGGSGTDTIFINSADIITLNGMSSSSLSKITSFEKVIVNTALGDSNVAANIFDVSDLSSISHIVLNEESNGVPNRIINMADRSTVELVETTIGNSDDDDSDTVADLDILTLRLKSASADNNTLTLKLVNENTREDWGVVDLSGVENIVVDSNTGGASSNANVLRLQLAGALTTLTVAGNAYTDFRAFEGTIFNFTTIDASANTGGISIATGSTANQTIIGSSNADIIHGGGGVDTITAGGGNDTIVLDGNLDTFASINGGSGTDAISISRADIFALNEMQSTEVDSLKSKITSIEKVIVNGALPFLSFPLDMSRLDDIKHIVLTQDNDSSNSILLHNNSTVEFTGSNWGDSDETTLDLVSNSVGPMEDTVNLILTNTGGENWGAVGTFDVEYIHIESNSTSGDTNVLYTEFESSAFVASYGLTITGNARLDLDGALVNILTIDASGNTGGLDVVGDTQNQTITGSSANDNIHGRGGDDTIIGGAGADNLIGGTGVDSMTGGDGADVFSFTDVTNSDDWSIVVTDTITDFVKGADKLDFITEGAYNNFLKNTSFQYGALGELAVYAEQALRLHAHDYYFGLVNNGTSADGYLFYDANGTGYTSIIKLTGVTDLDFGDIV